MATKTAQPAAKPNLFAHAAEKSAVAPKKKVKGTVLVLPKDLNKNGELQGESKILNEAITIAIAAKAEMDAAKGRLGAASGVLHSYTEEAWCATYASVGVQPATPVSIQNHKGEALTFVVQDKCGQNPVDAREVKALGILLGEEVAANLIETCEIFGFNPTTMKQVAGGDKANGKETVQDIIFKVVSEVIGKNPKLSDEQKEEMFTQVSKTYVKKNTLPRLSELCGSNVGKIQGFLTAAGSAFVRYLKV